MEENNVFAYITTEENNWKTARVPLTNSKSWNMREHIERCTNVANAWYHTGNNDGLRPYDDIVTPIINVAFRSEGFDTKDIVPYVNDITQSYKSFLVKKYHPQWARKNQLDTFIDDIVETSIIYDLVLVKNINNVRPEVVDLRTLAFCDQTDVMAGPICIKHNYTPAELVGFKGTWYSDEIDLVISESRASKKIAIANDQEVKTPGKYIEVYELRGNLPDSWINPDGNSNEYTPQMHIVAYYKDKDGNKQGITLFKGKDKPLSENFKALKIDSIRSKGRACGRSIVESLFEPQVWRNYDAIKIKELLDGALTIFQTDSLEYKDQKLNQLKTNTVLAHEPGKPITKIDGNVQNLTAFTNDQIKQENSARNLGSASDLSLGNSPVSGTPLGTTEIVQVEGQGIHVYRRGKIATFMADILYPDWILEYLVKEMDNGLTFSEDLSLDELQEVAAQIADNEVEKKIKEMILKTGEIPTEEERDLMIEAFKADFIKGGSRKFFEIVKGELKDIPVKVFVNIKSKQKDMVAVADKLTNIIREVIRNPEAFKQVPGIGKLFNEVVENSGLSPIDFTQITKGPKPVVQQEELLAPPVGGGQI